MEISTYILLILQMYPSCTILFADTIYLFFVWTQ
jgi:hypothetical protein